MLLDDRGRYLLCAVNNYLKCLQYSDSFDLSVFRLTSLWFDNLDSSDLNLSIGVSTNVAVFNQKYIT